MGRQKKTASKAYPVRITLNALQNIDEIPTKSKIYRRAICHSWSVVYRIDTNEIIILGIIHHSRRPSKIKKLRKIK